MNAEMQVLQALDAAQHAFRHASGEITEDRAQVIRAAFDQLTSAPWSMALRESEAEQHGWLSDVREALRRLDQDPYGEDAERIAEQGLWAANELERDLRRLVGAR